MDITTCVRSRQANVVRICSHVHRAGLQGKKSKLQLLRVESVFFLLARLWTSTHGQRRWEQSMLIVLGRVWKAASARFLLVMRGRSSLAFPRAVATLAAVMVGVIARQWQVQLGRLQSSKVAVAEKMREISTIEDPTFGPAIKHDMQRLDSMHEAFLDAMHLQKDSPMRGHLCQLFQRPDLDDQLCRLYDQVAAGAPRITRNSFARLSRGIHGHLHQLLKAKERMPLAACTAEDQQWIFRHFDHFFPAERPLDRRTFPGFFRLVLMRRIVRTLAARIGLSKLRKGTSAPLVLYVGVDLGDGHPPFRISTVTPNAKRLICGESLALIKETPQELENLADEAPQKCLKGLGWLRRSLQYLQCVAP